MTISDFRYFRDHPTSIATVEMLTGVSLPTDLDAVRKLAREIGRQHFEARLAGDDEHEDDADRWEVDE